MSKEGSMKTVVGPILRIECMYIVVSPFRPGTNNAPSDGERFLLVVPEHQVTVPTSSFRGAPAAFLRRGVECEPPE